MNDGTHAPQHNASAPVVGSPESSIHPSRSSPVSELRPNWKRHLWKLSKYGLFGALAVLVRIMMIYFFSRWWPFDEQLKYLSDHQRGWNFFIVNAYAFLFSNLVAYTGNALFVFEGGRHTRRREFVYFTLVSLIGWGIGSLFGPGMIALFGISDKLSVFNVIAVSLVVNYWGRRYLVFLR